MSSLDTSASVRLTGRVKWFNNKTGFGFITIVGGNEQFKDASEIFTHHSAIKVSQEQYRYLVEGEYVEFSVSNTASGEHKFQASDVRGVKGGKLFCETRHEQRSASSSAGASAGAGGSRPMRGRQVTRGSSRGGRGGRGGRGEWMLVRKDSIEYRGERGESGARGGGRVYSSRPSGERQRQQQESSVEHSGPKAASEPTPAVASTPSPAPTPASTKSSEVPATPKAASARKPKQSKPSS